MADPDAAAAFPIWHLRARADDGSLAWVAVVQSDRHADGADVERPVADAARETQEGLVGGTAWLGADGQVTRLELLPHRSELPPLWFVEVEEPDRDVPSAAVVAFTGGSVEPGTLLDSRSGQKARARTSDQVGAIRWYPHSGLVEQLYVAPTWRGRRIGTALGSAVAVLAVARDLPRPWVGSQRTAEGERMKQAGRWGHRAEDLTRLLPPMTPVDERGDVPPRS